MIDTTTINYGIGKLQSAFASIQPTLGGLTEQFVRYTVMQQALMTVAALVVMLVSILLLIKLVKYVTVTIDSTCEDNYTHHLEYAVPATFLFGAVIVCFVILVKEIPRTMLAFSFPEIFAVMSLVKQ